MKKILIVEPFFSGSHKAWAEQFQAASSHDIQILSLPGKFWKWRMYGGAVTLAETFLAMDFEPDYILATDMLDLSTFVALTRHRLEKTQIFLYFHENQLEYPWREDGEDKKENRDVHYGFTNYTSALVADQVLFNSKHNMETFYGRMAKLLKAMPDQRHKTIKGLYEKSKVLPIGIPLKKHDFTTPVYEANEPLILWNHRWEFDKNPEDFFRALIQLKHEGFSFKLALLGEMYQGVPEICQQALELFKDDIVAQGYMSGETYSAWLNAADILPVTSYHDFFGISVMEAIYCNTYPILPKRLTYPDLYHLAQHPEIFYETYEEFVALLREALQMKHRPSYRSLTEAYDWATIITEYDETFNNPSFD